MKQFRFTMAGVGVLTILGICLLPGTALAFSSGAGSGLSGAPGDGLCTQCHAFGPDDGDLVIEGLPANYELTQTYTLTVRLQDPGQARWGFQMTALDASNTGTGTFVLTNPVDTQLNTSGDREYINHTSTGTYAGTPDGPVTWQVDWVSPDTDVGVITLYAAGNAANNNSATSGDYIYSTSAAANPPGAATATPTIDVPASSSTGIAVLLIVISGLIGLGILKK